MKISKGFKLSIFTLIFILLILTTFYFYLFYTFLEKTESKSYFWVTIEGNVIPDENMSILLVKNKDVYLRNKPLNVYVFQNYYNLNTLCRKSDQIRYIEILWLNDTHGYYRIALRVPAKMNLVLTTNCEGCNKEIIEVNKNSNLIYLDLKWGIGNRVERFEVFTDSSKQIDHMKNVLNGVDDLLEYANFDLQLKEDIRKDTRKADELNLDAERSVDENERLTFSLQSQWFYERARYRIEFRKLEFCISKFNKLLQTYNNSICYMPEYEYYNKYTDYNQIYSSKLKELSNLMGDHPNNYQETDHLINQIEYNHGQREILEKSNWRCDEYYNLMNESFIHQSKYCNPKIVILNFFQSGIFILILLLGLIGGVIVEYNFKIFSRTEKYFDEKDKELVKWYKNLKPWQRGLLLFIPIFFFSFFLVLVVVYILFSLFHIPIDFNNIFFIAGSLAIAIISATILTHKKTEQ